MSAALAEWPPGSGNAPARRSPPPDWDRHRHAILDLYVGHWLTLDEVRRRMELAHNFFATTKMYKMQLKKWGIRKNRKLTNNKKKTGSSGNGGEDGDDIEVINVDTNSGNRAVVADPQSRIVFFQGDLGGPKGFQLALNTLSELMRRWKQMGITMAPADTLPYEGNPDAEFMSQMATGASLIRQGQHSDGFALVGHCFREVGLMMTVGASLPPLMTGAWILSMISEDLYWAYVRYVGKLAHIRGGNNDLTYLCARGLMSLTFDEFTRYGMGFVPLAQAIFRGHLGEAVYTPEYDEAHHLFQLASVALIFADQERLMAGNGQAESTLSLVKSPNESLDPLWSRRAAMWGHHLEAQAAVAQKYPKIRTTVREVEGMKYLALVHDKLAAVRRLNPDEQQAHIEVSIPRR